METQAALPLGCQQRYAGLFPGQALGHVQKRFRRRAELQRQQILPGVIRDAGDQMAGIEVVRMGMGLQQIPDLAHVDAKIKGRADHVRAQVDQQIIADQNAGAAAQVFPASPPGAAAGRAAAECQRAGRCRGGA